MSDNPYEILGMKADASDKDIKSAYRKLAKTLHPDLNPGDTAAEERFKRISAAYNLLGDKEQRARFDRGEIDASGMEKPQQQYYRSHAGAGPEQHYYSSGGFADFGDESDLFAELFRRSRGAHTQGRDNHRPHHGTDAQYQLRVDFLDAAQGATKRITMPDGGTLDVKVPAGIREGQKIRLKGKGMPGFNGGPSGDAYVMIDIAPHKTYRRDGNNILLDLPISLDEAVLGGKISVPTIHGTVAMNIAAPASSGKVLRLKGKGVTGSGKTPAGDQLVTLKIVMPEKIDDELQTFMQGWRDKNAYAVRKDLQGETA